jgi:hypothetical protein
MKAVIEFRTSIHSESKPRPTRSRARIARQSIPSMMRRPHPDATQAQPTAGGRTLRREAEVLTKWEMTQIFASWNRFAHWLGLLEVLKKAA